VAFAGAGLVLAALLALPGTARAQCVKDTDCKGDRICSAGSCVDAAPRAQVKVWALSAGASGVVSGGLTLGMAFAADILPRENPEDPIPPIAIGGTYLLTTIIQGPIIAAGGRSARVAAGVDGERGARVGGWIFYGVGIASFPAIVVYGFSQEGPPPPGWILGSGLACALSQALLAVDAFVSHTQALALAPKDEDGARHEAVIVVPSLAPSLGAGGANGAFLGLAGSF
jgi:hypothetical protein